MFFIYLNYFRYNSISVAFLSFDLYLISESSNNSLILLDDKGEKTNLSIDYMLKNNFKIINETD